MNSTHIPSPCCTSKLILRGPLEGCLPKVGTAPGTQQRESAGDVEVLPDLVSGSIGTHSSQSANRDNGMGCGRIAARKSR